MKNLVLSSEINKLKLRKVNQIAKIKNKESKEDETLFIIDISKIEKEYLGNPIKTINKLNSLDYKWFLFSNKPLSRKQKKVFSKLLNYGEPCIFNSIHVNPNLDLFSENIIFPGGLLVKKDLYLKVGGCSIKYYDFRFAFFDLLRKINHFKRFLDLSKIDSFNKINLFKNKAILKFERDLFLLLEREPLYALEYDKKLSKRIKNG